MNDDRFATLARKLTTPRSRRHALRLLAGSLVSGLGAARILTETGPSSRIAAQVATPALTLTPTSGSVNTSVNAVMTGFMPNKTVTLRWFNGATAITVASSRADLTGRAQVGFRAPEGARDLHWVEAVGGRRTTARATFQIVPSIALAPTSGPDRTPVTATMRGYLANEQLELRWYNGSTTYQVLQSVAVSSLGSATTTFTVPGRAGIGSHQVEGARANGSRAAAWFNVTVRVRRSVHALAPDGPEMTAFRRGVAAMKARPSTDPTSWIAQANLHPNVCQHGSFFFFSWHRMYTYWFERILRKAAGDPTLALPYWNYADPEQRVLPLPFRQPADTSNPFYVAERAPAVNAGQAPGPDLDPIFDHSLAFAETTFFNTAPGSNLSFGGQRVTSPVHLGPGKGRLENTPHDPVHDWVGGRMPNGQPGWMGTLGMAARDPIFWLHHSNIDRLWERWLDLGGGRANPTADSDWMNDQFAFYDEDGRQVVMTGQAIVNTVGQLGYRYDDEPSAQTSSATRTAAAAATTASREVGASAANEGLALGRRRVAMPVALTEALPDVRSARVGGPGRRVVLTLQGVRGERAAGVAYAVYVNLPRGGRPDPRGAAYVGLVSLFGLRPWDARSRSHGSHGSPGTALSFDITRAVGALQARGEGRDRLEVTFVPLDLATSAPPPGIWAHIARAKVTIQG